MANLLRILIKLVWFVSMWIYDAK